MPQSHLLHEFARQHADLSTFDEEAARAFQMRSRHLLLVSLEHCTSQRPSLHLRGASDSLHHSLHVLLSRSLTQPHNAPLEALVVVCRAVTVRPRHT